MTTSTEVSVTWAQALAWRMERQLLDPVGTESVASVVRRLGAVLSMDESLAELAVWTRRTTSRPSQLAKAGQWRRPRRRAVTRGSVRLGRLRFTEVGRWRSTCSRPSCLSPEDHWRKV
jgi:hypothetical protein